MAEDGLAVLALKARSLDGSFLTVGLVVELEAELLASDIHFLTLRIRRCLNGAARRSSSFEGFGTFGLGWHVLCNKSGCLFGSGHRYLF
jgi:hypothetical protein